MSMEELLFKEPPSTTPVANNESEGDRIIIDGKKSEFFSKIYSNK